MGFPQELETVDSEPYKRFGISDLGKDKNSFGISD